MEKFQKNLVVGVNSQPSLGQVYTSLRRRLRHSFRACAMCAGSGTGGALVSHVGCVLVPVFAGASGTALSSQLMSLMLVASPTVAAAVTAGIDKLQGKRFSLFKVGASAALGLAIASGVQAYTGHHHGAVSNEQAQAYLDGLTPDARQNFREFAQMTRQTELEAAKNMCGAASIQTDSKPQQPEP